MNVINENEWLLLESKDGTIHGGSALYKGVLFDDLSNEELLEFVKGLEIEDVWAIKSKVYKPCRRIIIQLENETYVEISIHDGDLYISGFTYRKVDREKVKERLRLIEEKYSETGRSFLEGRGIEEEADRIMAGKNAKEWYGEW